MGPTAYSQVFCEHRTPSGVERYGLHPGGRLQQPSGAAPAEGRAARIVHRGEDEILRAVHALRRKAAAAPDCCLLERLYAQARKPPAALSVLVPALDVGIDIE